MLSTMIKNPRQKIGDRLRGAREALDPKLGQAELSRELGLSRSAIAQYETGRSMMSAEILARTAVRLHRSADYLLGLSDDPTPAAERMAGDIPVFLCPLLSSRDIRSPDAWRGLHALGWVQMSETWPIGQAAAWRMPDDSMAPTIPQHALVILSRALSIDIANVDGDANPIIVMVDVGSVAPIVRRILRDGNNLFLQADNPRLPLRPVEKGFKVVGRVVETVLRQPFLYSERRKIR